MEVDCTCNNGTTSAGTVCSICNGDGKVDLTDSTFNRVNDRALRSIRGTVWGTILTNHADLEDKIADLEDKIDDIVDKLNDILEQVSP